MVECTGFENRHAERHRGFESSHLRNDSQGLLNAVRAEHHCVRAGNEKAGGRRAEAGSCEFSTENYA